MRAIANGIRRRMRAGNARSAHHIAQHIARGQYVMCLNYGTVFESSIDFAVQVCERAIWCRYWHGQDKG